MIYVISALSVGVIIFTHELGHYIGALLTGISVKTFSLGYGPKLFSFDACNTEFRISLIPIGGYVLPDIESIEEFEEIPVVKRIVFSFFGPFFNLLLSFLIFSLVFCLTNGPSLTNLVVSPAKYLFYLLGEMIRIVPGLFSSSENLTGIVGIIAGSNSYLDITIVSVLNFMAMISINLGFFNLLPIPALDGGKIFLYVIELFYKKINRFYYHFSLIGWGVLAVLFIFTFVLDFRRILG